MKRRSFLVSAAGLGRLSRVYGAERPPNIVLILADNLGYGDLGCYGSTLNRTPHIDGMAGEGMRFTDFYSASGVCTPSRAALMTGCYPRRVGLHYTGDGAVLRPISHYGLNPDEVTVAEALKSRRYATTIIGKWHLGDQPPFLPTRQGFDYYFGIPYSDDMAAGRPAATGRTAPPLPLMENEKVVEAPVDRDMLTKRYTGKCIEAINRHSGGPFFIFLSHAMPGSTSSPFSSERFRGKSRNGPYGDSVEEIDWSTGEILSALKRSGLDDHTLVIFTSDNGAPLLRPSHGSNLPLSGWGYTTAEGGQRVPFIARWPGKIPRGAVNTAMAAMMDVHPTFAGLAGARPHGQAIDGRDLWPLLAGRAKESPHEAFYYYYGPQLQAVRSGNWKLVLPSQARWVTLTGTTEKRSVALYDLGKDVGETTDVARAHPHVVRRLTSLAEKARTDLGDVERPGKGQRRAGWVEDPSPRVL
jgi:arylsulfatase A